MTASLVRGKAFFHLICICFIKVISCIYEFQTIRKN
jgi:hypothetical protein